MPEEEKQFSSRVIKNTTIVSVAGLVTKFIGLGSTLTVLYFLSVYEYGVYKLVFAAYGLLASFLFVGIDNIILADASVDWGRKNFGRVKRLFVEYFFLKLALGVGLWIITFWGADFIGRFYGENIVYFLKIISFLFLISPFKALLGFTFKLNLSFLNASLLTMIEEAIKLAFVLFFFFVLGMAVDGVILAYVLGSFFSVLILFIFSPSFLSQLLKAKISSEFILADTIKKHGKWGILSNYSMDIQKNTHPWLIKFFLGTEAVAIFSVAQSLLGHAASLFPFVQVLMPTVPREIDNKERLKRIFFRGIKYGTAGFVGIAVLMFFVMPPFIHYAFPKYVSSLPVFKILLITLAFSGVANVLTSLFYAFKMQKNMFIITIWRLIFMVAMAVVLFPVFGVAGVAIEVVLTFIFFVGMRYREILKVEPGLSFNFRELFKFDSYDRALLNKIKVYIISKFKHQNAK